jgi:hypothetical protein
MPPVVQIVVRLGMLLDSRRRLVIGLDWLMVVMELVLVECGMVDSVMEGVGNPKKFWFWERREEGVLLLVVDMMLLLTMMTTTHHHTNINQQLLHNSNNVLT